MPALKTIIDANEAVASVAYQTNEVIAIYPITPASPMGEWADQWASEGRPNLWGCVPRVIELQSEAGAAGTVHGALQTGALTTTFTASQGLLLMIPNMYKIAGELTAAVIHVAARSLAAQGLSIFGDHSDVMATRSTGWAMLCSCSVQEAADFALIAQAATLASRIPFLHFFDGFRTSHEINTVDVPDADVLRAMLDERAIAAHRQRALSPDRPCVRGTAQNPDVYFQARESVNPFYRACPVIVQNAFNEFAKLTGRQYRLYEYYGDPAAERVIVMMGSGAEAAIETVDALNQTGERVGVLRVRLFRPFDVSNFIAALPATVRSIAVLDRTKEPGSIGEPLYQDVVTAIAESDHQLDHLKKVIGGRYGLSSKEFTPAMIKAVFDELSSAHPKNHFTVGIHDDLTQTSLTFDPSFSTEDPETMRAVFYGLGSDGTVSANKNSIKIIGGETAHHAQGFFVYDSKKAGSVTTSHLRFGPRPVRSTYLISRASFVACHQFPFIDRIDMLRVAEPGGTFLLNAPFPAEEVWSHLPREVQQAIIDKRLKLFTIEADRVARESGLGGRINTIMQTCFFALTTVLSRDVAIEAIKASITKSYGKRGAVIVDRNHAAVDAAISNLHEVEVPRTVTASFDRKPTVPHEAPEFVRQVTAAMIAGNGDLLPVSALPCDGTYPSATTRWERRNIADEIPVWDEKLCIQCGKCVFVCPHSVIRAQLAAPDELANAPATFKSAPARWPDFKDQKYVLQVAPEDCTGCGLCVEICPVKNKSEARLKALNMSPVAPLHEQECGNWSFFLGLQEKYREQLRPGTVKDVQLFTPLFEFSGACAGCGETPYLKALSQLFGDRLLIANATGCSSIYGGNLPTTPWSVNVDGRGPAWSNSLFEDNAEFGLGMRLAVDHQTEFAQRLLKSLAGYLGDDFVTGILSADQSNDAGLRQQRERVAALKEKLQPLANGGANGSSATAATLLQLADMLVRKSVWIVGGDGWAYDIGYGGLDHVLASGHNVKVLVLDTEVYSNTGGQMSKATPRGAIAKFAAAGKQAPKKDLALIAMTYGNIYVARIAFGANDAQTLKALCEAEAFDGPALIIAFSHCIAHGYDLRHGLDQQKAAVNSGYWPMVRFDPRLSAEGKNPLQLDSNAATMPLRSYMQQEGRFSFLTHAKPGEANELLHEAELDVSEHWRLYEHWSHLFDKQTGKSP